MSDFGADVFDQDRPKRPKPRAPQDDRPASLPPPPTGSPRETASQSANRSVQTAAPALPEAPRRAEAGALPPEPAPIAGRREARSPREPDERFEPAESRWRDDPKRIPSQPPRRGPAEHHGPPAHRRPEPGRTEPHAHKERHTEFRSSHEPGEPRPQRASAAQEPVRLIERPSSPPATAPRVGLLVDLEGLQAEARAQQGELAMHRLRTGLGSGRTVAKALAIAKNAGAAPSGFDLIVSSGGFAAGVQFAAAAVELLRVAPVLVMAPTSDPIRKLATALRAAGHTVELAGFATTEATARRFGRDCIFVP
jgi:hypothetical protein